MSAALIEYDGIKQGGPLHPAVGHLECLFSLSGFSRNQLRRLAARLDIKAARPGACLLSLGGDPPYHLYLLQGMVRLVAEDGRESVISHKDLSARYALAHLRPSRYRVVALTEVLYVEIGNDLLQTILDELHKQPPLDGYEVADDNAQAIMSVENQLIYRIYNDLKRGALVLPSLSPLAQNICQAVSSGDDDVHVLVDIISADPVIASKLLRTVNQARSSNLVRIGSLPEALAWLGRERTHALVLNLAKQEVFIGASDKLAREMSQLLRHSRQIAAISHVLALETTGFDPDTALLAGLLHDIGSLAIVAYAGTLSGAAEDPVALHQAIIGLRGQIGEMIIRHWDLPPILAEVAHEAENWRRQHEGEADYVDLVIVAQAHGFIVNGQQGLLPPLDQMPAFDKLGFTPTVEHSLLLLEQAKREIKHIEAVLGCCEGET